MKLKSEENTEELNNSSTNSLYKRIIRDRLCFIEESLRVIRDAFSHLDSEDESND